MKDRNKLEYSFLILRVNVVQNEEHECNARRATDRSLVTSERAFELSAQ